MANHYKCTPRQARGFIEQILEAGLVPFLQSSPGVGKSALHRLIAKAYTLWMIDHRLSTSDPTDLNGLPHKVNGRATFLPFDLFPTAATPIPDGFLGWLIFLDEFNSAPKAIQAAAYKLILDRMIGQHALHEKAVLACAGNLATDRAITNTLSTAMQSRLIHLEMEVSHQEWLEDVALAEDYDFRIIAFLNQWPGKLMDFRPDHSEMTFCCPRTWEFVNRLIKGKELNDLSVKLLAGTITSGVAMEFVQFTKMIKDMVTVRDILKDPKTCPIPRDIAVKWAVISAIMERIDAKNFADLATYANRFDTSFRILFFRSVLVRNPELRTHPAFFTSMTGLSQYINAPD